MKNLGRIAVAGISVGIVGAIIAAALHVDDLGELAGKRGHYFVWGDKGCDGKTADATGNELHLAWDGDDSVTIAVPAKVHYRGGEGVDVVVRGEPGAINQIRVQGGKIEACHHYVRRGQLDITLPGRAFRSVTVAGTGDVNMENVAAPDLSLVIAGSGNIKAQGSAERLTVNIAGSGDAYLGALTVKQLSVTIAGSGNAEAAPQDDANITIMGSGDVKLLTKPAHLSSNVMGSGRVRQEDTKPESNASASPAKLDTPQRGCGPTILTLNVEVAEDIASPRDCSTIVTLNARESKPEMRVSASRARLPHILM